MYLIYVLLIMRVCIELGDQRDLTPFDTNWKKGSGATPLTTQDL